MGKWNFFLFVWLLLNQFLDDLMETDKKMESTLAFVGWKMWKFVQDQISIELVEDRHLFLCLINQMHEFTLTYIK